MREVMVMKRIIGIMILLAIMIVTIMTIGAFAESAPTYLNMTRIYGKDRYETAFAAADMIFEKNGGPFDGMVVASGHDYPDALSAMMLTHKQVAKPLILTSDATVNRTLDYIHSKIKSGGQVFIVGGTGVVSQGLEDTLRTDGYEVTRLGGKDRYETNSQILNSIPNLFGEYELAICSGKTYADALSAGTDTRMLMMIVGDSLTESQIHYLSTHSFTSVRIFGGEGAVSKQVEREIAKYIYANASIERIAGRDRFETSALAAQKLSESSESITLAYGYDYPDGLVAGVFSYLYSDTFNGQRSPVILAAGPDQIPEALRTYIGNIKVEHPQVYVFGGPKLILDSTVSAIMMGELS